MLAYKVSHFCTVDGTDVFGEWFDALRDRQAQQRIAVRIDRLALGLFGDAKALRKGEARACGNSESTTGLDIASITPLPAAASYCSYAAATSERSVPT